ncbi:MAG: hypothetical protein NVSMB21_25980 [Vulcanimicrobiaceae bacterium]
MANVSALPTYHAALKRAGDTALSAASSADAAHATISHNVSVRSGRWRASAATASALTSAMTTATAEKRAVNVP